VLEKVQGNSEIAAKSLHRRNVGWTPAEPEESSDHKYERLYNIEAALF